MLGAYYSFHRGGCKCQGSTPVSPDNGQSHPELVVPRLCPNDYNRYPTKEDSSRVGTELVRTRKDIVLL
jgi:hypothetical protein